MRWRKIAVHIRRDTLAISRLYIGQGLNCQKISGEVDICLFIVIVITHRRFSIINNGGGLKLTPQGILFGG
jgi:hypothetical protein